MRPGWLLTLIVSFFSIPYFAEQLRSVFRGVEDGAGMCVPWNIVSACVMTTERELMSHDEAASVSVVIVDFPAFTDAGHHELASSLLFLIWILLVMPQAPGTWVDLLYLVQRRYGNRRILTREYSILQHQMHLLLGLQVITPSTVRSQ